MQSLAKKRHRQRSSSPSTDSSDSENRDPQSSVSRKRVTKRTRREVSLGGMQAELGEMKTIFAKSMSAQAKYQEEVTNQLKASNEAYIAGQRIFAEILREKL